MTISYAITACNELQELQRLIDQLHPVVRPEDEIVLQLDTTATQEVKDVARQWEATNMIRLVEYSLNKNFADFKNNLKNECKKDYIVFIDADETLSEILLHHMPIILESNPVDLFYVPRANTVAGLTEDHVRQWGWRVENGLVNWPDFQGRIVKNLESLRWEGAVHERVVGSKTVSWFPIDNKDYCLHHDKSIEKQEQQNRFYNTI
jgi:glycosyltransferase involved in cell wall biosynthesis